MKKKICVAVVLLLSASAFAHPGKTDRQGGHKCWKNCEEWELVLSEYHLHDRDGNPIRLGARGNPVPAVPSGEIQPPAEVQASPNLPVDQTPAAVPVQEEKPLKKEEDKTVIDRSYNVMIPEESVLPIQSILLMALAVLLLAALLFVRKRRDKD